MNLNILENVICLDKINALIDRHITAKTLHVFSRFLDKNSSYKINTHTISEWRKRNSELYMSDVDLTSMYLHSIEKIRFRLLYLIDWKSTVSIILTLLDSNNLSQKLKKYALLETGNILTG